MAARKSDSFFIRALNLLTTTFDEVTIDLGAFVDALGQSVLRIHNIQVQYLDETTINIIAPAIDSQAIAQWQVTTQPQATIVTADNKALVSSGSLYMGGAESTTAVAWAINDSVDMNISEWKNGYLIATEQLYLGGLRNGNWASSDMNCSIVMECTVEKLSKEAALALALSQQ